MNTTTKIHIISGPLGSGKTTTIRNLLSQRPPDESWSILLNEYGLIGIDEAILRTTSPVQNVELREVAGGCICCSAGIMFDISLVLLLKRRPQRLFIEPSGLAAVSNILETLARPGIAEYVELCAVVALIDPATLIEHLQRPEFQDQVACADLLFANRADLASHEHLQHFTEWAQTLNPNKEHTGHLEHGALSLDQIDTARPPKPSPTQHRDAHLQHTHHHPPTDPIPILCNEHNPILCRAYHTEYASTVGWVCWDGLRFDATRIASWLKSLHTLHAAMRCKAIVHTNTGWVCFNTTPNSQHTQTTQPHKDSRIEVILSKTTLPRSLERSLRACVVSSSPTP